MFRKRVDGFMKKIKRDRNVNIMAEGKKFRLRASSIIRKR